MRRVSIPYSPLENQKIHTMPCSCRAARRSSIKSVRAVYVRDTGECLVASDVYRSIGYDRKAGVQAIQRLVPERYKMRLSDAGVTLKGVLKCGKPEAEPFMEWVCEKVLPREVRKLTTVVEEKYAQIALLSDDLVLEQEHARHLEYNKTGLHGEIRAKDQEIDRRREEIVELRERYVDHCRDPSKDNLVVITRKHEPDDKYPYYISRIQRRVISTKRRWLLDQFPDSEEIVVIDNPNSVHTFNRLEEEGHVERYGCHFKLLDLTREDLYDLGVPAIQE